MSEQVRPEVLISRLTSENQAWRADAEARLVSLGEAAVDPLIAALRHANPAVRIHAVHALARLRSPRAIAPVIGALSETENTGAVAIAAEKALVEWGQPVKSALLDAAKAGPEAVRAGSSGVGQDRRRGLGCRPSVAPGRSVGVDPRAGRGGSRNGDRGTSGGGDCPFAQRS